ncbi:MAG: hypothetical protein ABR567_07425 [Myxococcales bacterium]
MAVKPGISLAGIDAGSYAARVGATFAGDSSYPPASLSNVLVVSKADQAIGFGPLADKVATDPPFAVSATGGGSGNAVTFASTTGGVCSVSGATVTLVASGTCSISADQLGSSNYNAAPTVTRSFTVTKAPQSIAFPALTGFVWNAGSATLAATADSGLAVTYSVLSGPCSVTGSTLTAGGAGTCVVAADQGGNGIYFAAPQAQVSVAIAKASQAISFASLPDRVATDPDFTLTASGGASGSPVVFTTGSTGVCSISGNTVSLITSGICAVDANQAGNADYDPATPVSQSFTVSKASQTISFAAIVPFSWSGGFATLSATATSALPIAWSVVSGPCGLSGSTLTATAAGTCTVSADQGGDARYSAAPQVTASVDVSKASQAIAFATLGDKVATDAPFTVAATGGASGYPVTFSTNSTACSISNTTVTLNAAGSCAITASQAGDANYEVPADVTRTFNVAAAAQTISFPAIASFVWSGGSSTVAASASSALPVSYSVQFGKCTVTGTTVTSTEAGSCIIAADQPGNAKYSAAPQVTATVSVNKAPQSIGFGALADRYATAAAFAVSASGGASGNAVTFSTGSTACSVSGNTVTPLVIGACTVKANQAGDANYEDAPEVSETFSVLATPQTITFPAVTAFSWSGGFATLSATADSTLAVGFTVVSGPCLIAAGTLTANHAGSCVIAADQAGDNRYAAAAQATQTVTILKASQAIAFAPLADKVATDPDFTIAASGGPSGSAVTFSTSSTGVCSISGDTVILLAAGTCAISADQAGNADYADAFEVTQTFDVAFAGQTIDFPAISSFVWWSGSATLSASATSDLDVVYSVVSGPCSISATTVTATAAGSCVISADQAGDRRYAAAAQATQTVIAAKASQAIDFPAVASFVWSGGSTTVSASASSGLPVAYSVVSGPCVVTGTTVTASGAGACLIAADQAGNASYAGAPQVTATVAIAKASQSIMFGALPPRVATDAPFTVSTTGGGSGQAVTLSTVSIACSMSGNLVTILAAGTCAIAADQAGDANYTPAPQVVQSFSIASASQVITFPAAAGFVWKTGSATLAASASSGLPIAYSLVSGPCAISGATLTANHAGNCVVAANQPGDARYGAASQVATTVEVRGAPQAIRFGVVPDKLTTDAPFAVPATGDASGNPVTFSSNSTACSVSGAMVTLNSAGTCSISADQAGNADYLPAPTVTQDLPVSLAPQTIDFAPIASYSRRDAPTIPLVASSTSGLPVAFSLISGPCTVSGTMLTAHLAGKCVVAADQAGSTRYGPAGTVTQSVTVTDAVQAAVGGCASGGSPGAMALFGLAFGAIVLSRRRRS